MKIIPHIVFALLTSLFSVALQVSPAIAQSTAKTAPITATPIKLTIDVTDQRTYSAALNRVARAVSVHGRAECKKLSRRARFTIIGVQMSIGQGADGKFIGNADYDALCQ